MAIENPIAGVRESADIVELGTNEVIPLLERDELLIEGHTSITFNHRKSAGKRSLEIYLRTNNQKKTTVIGSDHSVRRFHVRDGDLNTFDSIRFSATTAQTVLIENDIELHPQLAITPDGYGLLVLIRSTRNIPYLTFNRNEHNTSQARREMQQRFMIPGV